MTGRTRTLARIGLLSLTCLLVGRMAAAQDFWVKKDYTQWSDDELKKFLSESPWVKKYEWVRSTGPETSNFISLTFAWENSTPVRWATLRTKMGKPGDAPADAKQFLEQPQDTYAIKLSGLPNDVIAEIQRAQGAAAVGTVLKIGKREIPLKQMGLAAATAPAPGAGRASGAAAAGGGGGGGRGGGRGGGGGAGTDPAVVAAMAARGGRGGGTDLFLFFSRENPIKVEEGEVEVIVKFGSLKIAPKAFKLKDMVINGKLEL